MTYLSGLEDQLEQLRTKLMMIESLGNRIKDLERHLGPIENTRAENQSDDVYESRIWRELDELRGFVERLSIAVTQLESEVQTMALSTSHLEDD